MATKASDNPYPSLMVVEGAVPASPAAGRHRLYVDSADHKLKRVDSAGAVKDLEAGTALLYDAKGDILISTGNDAPARLGVGADGQVLMADSTTAQGVKWGTAGGGAPSSWVPSGYEGIGLIANGAAANSSFWVPRYGPSGADVAIASGGENFWPFYLPNDFPAGTKLRMRCYISYGNVLPGTSLTFSINPVNSWTSSGRPAGIGAALMTAAFVSGTADMQTNSRVMKLSAEVDPPASGGYYGFVVATGTNSAGAAQQHSSILEVKV